jgi:dihydroorotate dehydrogenase electron transfer subunit
MKKEIFEAQVINNREIAAGVYRMTLHCGLKAAEAIPGQFVNLYQNDKSMLLPRPISICRVELDRITLVYRVVGKGTDAISRYQEGDILKVSTPLGQGYYLDRLFQTLEADGPGEKKIVLVAGGLGVPPMVGLAKEIRMKISAGTTGIKIIAALGFQDELFLTEELESFCDEVLVATESGTSGFHGNVIAMMEAQDLRADYYLSCGPKPMLKALAQHCASWNKPLQVSMEERMGCGYGACVGCTCKTIDKSNGTDEVRQKKVCKDGPVFFGDEVIWND